MTTNDKELDEITTNAGYDIEHFKESYRKYHDGKEPTTAYMVDLLATQSAVLAEVDQAIQTLITKARMDVIHDIDDKFGGKYPDLYEYLVELKATLQEEKT